MTFARYTSLEGLLGSLPRQCMTLDKIDAFSTSSKKTQIMRRGYKIRGMESSGFYIRMLFNVNIDTGSRWYMCKPLKTKKEPHAPAKCMDIAWGGYGILPDGSRAFILRGFTCDIHLHGVSVESPMGNAEMESIVAKRLTVRATDWSSDNLVPSNRVQPFTKEMMEAWTGTSTTCKDVKAAVQAMLARYPAVWNKARGSFLLFPTSSDLVRLEIPECMIRADQHITTWDHGMPDEKAEFLEWRGKRVRR